MKGETAEQTRARLDENRRIARIQRTNAATPAAQLVANRAGQGKGYPERVAP